VREIAGNEAFAVLDHILEEVNFTPEDVDDYIRKFSEVIPLDPERFYVPQPAQKSKPVESKPHEPVRVATNKVRTENPNSSLNDQLLSSQQPAVMDNLRKISKIKETLSINQKFMFTKVLFYGDFDSFSRAIDELDSLPDMKSAMTFLEQHSSAWDRDSNEFHEFMEMVEKRFS
jgi:hypothetical protein